MGQGESWNKSGKGKQKATAVRQEAQDNNKVLSPEGKEIIGHNTPRKCSFSPVIFRHAIAVRFEP